MSGKIRTLFRERQTGPSREERFMFRRQLIHLALLVTSSMLLTVAVRAESTEAVESKFKVFCEEWMGKLAARERDNVQNIKWDTRADGVFGSYTAYSHEHTCVMKSGTNSVPVGTITYLEYLYEKRGSSIPEAKSSPPHPVETTEVTEIFRYSAGKWIY
jgi:hypothetical protein